MSDNAEMKQAVKAIEKEAGKGIPADYGDALEMIQAYRVALKRIAGYRRFTLLDAEVKWNLACTTAIMALWTTGVSLDE